MNKGVSQSALAEASDPTTPPERLRALFTQPGGDHIHKALAKNPRTPLDILFRLFPEQPNQVAENPALPHILQTDPELFARIPRRTQFELATNPMLTEAALRLLQPGASHPLLQVLSLRPDVSESFLQTLAVRGADIDRLLQSPHAGPALWCKAAQIRHRYLPSQNQIFLSREPDLPECAKQILATHSDDQVRQSLAFRDKPAIQRAIPRLDCAGATEPRRIGNSNEDRVLLFHNSTAGLFLVADGMSGGSHTGHIAAEKICETALAAISSVDVPIRAQDFYHSVFYESFHHIARSVFHSYDHSEYFNGRWFDTNGAGATVASVLIQGTQATIAHIGDCRVYLLRDGRLSCMTQDHNLEWLAGKNNEMIPPEAVKQYRNVLVWFLGSDGVCSSPALTRVDVRPGDRLLLCSDGVHAVIPDDRLCELLCFGSAQDVVHRITEAWQNAGSKDDFAVVVVSIGETP